MTSPFADRDWMARALALAARGQGLVEPNPLVGCVLVRDGAVVGEGFHARFGGPHAEVVALQQAGAAARGATAYVTLEPCAHHGKTPPCTDALLAAGVTRVVAALADPFPQVAGRGVEQLRAAGVEVELGLLGDEAAELNAPYLKLLRAGRPWVIAKWAMTLDGKLATRTGDSRWISSPPSRAIVHRLRGRMDAVLVGAETALVDDPLLTARPPGFRTPLRIVVDSQMRLPLESRLVRTARETPVLVATTAAASPERSQALVQAGCQVLACGAGPRVDLGALLDELGRRRLTNILVEGGGRLLGALFDAGAIDEVHVFINPRLIGGAAAPTPLAGLGLDPMADARPLRLPVVEHVGDDVYVQGRLTGATTGGPATGGGRLG